MRGEVTPFDSSVLPSRLLEAATIGNVVPLVGAGVSRQAGTQFPGWVSLLEQLRDHAQELEVMNQTEAEEVTDLISKQELLMAAEALRKKVPIDAYTDFLNQHFNPPGVDPAPIHKTLFRLDPPIIITTNYDRLLENAYAEVQGRAPTVYTYKRADAVQKYLQTGRWHPTAERPIIFKIHGTIEEPDDIIFSMRDYRKILYWEQGYRLVLSAIFLTQVVLMIGFSFADPELRVLLEFLRDSLKKQNQPDFIFLPEGSIGDLQKARMREDFGVDVISYHPSGDHDELLGLISFLSAQREMANGGEESS